MARSYLTTADSSAFSTKDRSAVELSLQRSQHGPYRASYSAPISSRMSETATPFPMATAVLVAASPGFQRP